MASKDTEKFYWWKKDKNYYSNHKIKALEKKKNGYAYSVLLDKIKCESTPYQGILRFSETRAFTIEELSAVVDMPVKLVKSGLEALEELELIHTQENGAIEIIGFTKCVGSETGKARRMKDYREAQEMLQKGSNEPKCSLESRVKSQEIRDKNIYNLSSSFINYVEESEQLSPEKKEKSKEVLMMMSKANQITNIQPTYEALREIYIHVMDSENIYNLQGYIVNCFKRELRREMQ